jgi:hypothetical protein
MKRSSCDFKEKVKIHAFWNNFSVNVIKKSKWKEKFHKYSII